MLEATARFPCDPAAVRRARIWTADTLTMWRTRPDAIEEVVLLISELASNAVQHARTGFAVSLLRDDRQLRASVADDNPDLPTVLEQSLDAVHGRGLHLVQAVSNSWGIDPTSPIGKVIWFELLN